MRVQFVIPVLASILILGTFSFVIPPSQALSNDYKFINIAGTDDVIDGKTLTFTQSPSLNNNGDVVFTGFFSGDSGIFTPTSLIVDTGDVIDGKTLNFIGRPSLNDNDDVVFQGGFSRDDGIFTPTSLIAGTGDVIDGKTLTTPQSPSLNDNDDVVFRGFFTDRTNAIILATTPTSTIINEIKVIINDNLGTPLADKLEDANAKLQIVLSELVKSPPDNQAAVGNIGDAVGDIEASIGLGTAIEDAALTSIMDDLAGIARQLAVDAIEAAIAGGGDAAKILDAQLSLDGGDPLRTSEDFKDAVNKYKDAVAKAESALP